ncbi:DUF4198 domain-containing protein [Acidovorax sp. SUPP2522]|uniref:DUF4198 domain-containing protein n=1 Tax=unclassified Acidovorax TaxID=2684926 RepID=UPI00234BDD15|nr:MULTISPECIES: DUF4198 domain-containing protein [unclassified Acidovorax]WCM96640.1 DUF4198 domain-containing protein [Acidovorax sp. GBBC 1281]GKT19259.1 DUF4198 domain-containing protein [Acidovorax sp. SUPP2522]
MMKAAGAMRYLLRLALLAAGALGPLAAQAHGVWVAQRTGQWALVLGEGPVDDEYQAQAVKSVQGRAADGSSLTVALKPQSRNVLVDASPDVAAVALAFEDGYWSRGTDGKWVSGPRSQVPAAKKSGYYMMYTTTVLRPIAGGPAQPFGLPLEIVPLADPLSVKRGERLAVQVLFEGRPLVGAMVRADYIGDTHGKVLKTDANGRVQVRLGSSGLNVIKANHTRERTDRTEADEDGFSATLAFTLPQPKD